MGREGLHIRSCEATYFGLSWYISVSVVIFVAVPQIYQLRPKAWEEGIGVEGELPSPLFLGTRLNRCPFNVREPEIGVSSPPKIALTTKANFGVSY